MEKNKGKNGFTMVEILLALAILSVLFGLAAMALISHQRTIQQFELDGIAKEIFVAVQNHLTMADSQGYPGLGSSEYIYGSPDENEEGYYYFYVSVTDGRIQEQPEDPSADGPSVLDMMLPDWAVDKNILAGGNCIIRYQLDTARVSDVFFAEKSGRYARAFETTGTAGTDEYKHLLDECRGVEKKPNRLKYQYDGSNSVIGWYGADAASLDRIPVELSPQTPTLEVVNGEQLYARITYGSIESNVDTRLVITGKTSGVTKVITLGDAHQASPSEYKVVLDDITQNGLHFAQQFASSLNTNENLIPGEDIEIKAVASRTDAFALPVESAVKMENSLFASRTGNTVDIANIRHLENLSYEISHMDTNSINAARQTQNLDWSVFLTNIKSPEYRDMPVSSSVTVFSLPAMTGADPAETKANTFMPVNWGNDVSNLYSIDYDGTGKSIDGIAVDTEGAAGLFGSIAGGSVQNLELKNFSIKSTGGDGYAGALAGYAENVTVTGVLARNVPAAGANDANLEILATGNNADAGGLIGRLTSGTVNVSAAALYVRSDKGHAGGLIGSAYGSEINYSYSGGHTTESTVYDNAAPPSGNAAGRYAAGRFNVVSMDSGGAGGLLGAVSGTVNVRESYSTCSVYAAASAGKLTGTVEDGGEVTISDNCYGAGLVKQGASEQMDTVPTRDHTNTNAIPYTEDLGHSYPFTTISDRSGTSLSGVEGYDTNMTAIRLALNHYGDWQTASLSPDILEIENAERLTANLTIDKSRVPASGLTLTIRVTGKTSGSYRQFTFKLTETGTECQEITDSVSGTVNVSVWSGMASTPVLSADEKQVCFSLLLDSVTKKNAHFVELFPKLTPGEEVTVSLYNGAGTGTLIVEKETNSLFESIETGERITANIANIRHLENLDNQVSGVNKSGAAVQIFAAKQVVSLCSHPGDADSVTSDGSAVMVDLASRRSNYMNQDLSFAGFIARIKEKEGNDSVYIYKTDGKKLTSTVDTFHPVKLIPGFEYDGNEKKITGIVVEANSDANPDGGLFGTLSNGTVKNLELIDFKIKSAKGNAGALAGTVTGSRGTITGVLVHNTPGDAANPYAYNAANPNVCAEASTDEAKGHAGGLIGYVGAETRVSVSKSAASVYVKATGSGDAGGLIGYAAGDMVVSDSYSGGHTRNGGVYGSGPNDWNVTSVSGCGGGLIGRASAAAQVGNCYSTCSVYSSGGGRTAGGLIGESSGGSVSNSYATGLVGAADGTNRYAFAGDETMTGDRNYYYRLVDTGLTDIVPEGAAVAVTDVEKDVATYRSFFLTTANATCSPYDEQLRGVYTNYPLKAIAPPFGNVYHYGDWPIPETKIINTP